MPAKLTVDSRSLGRLLGQDLRVRVPDYQRHYSWSEKEAGQLLDDLLLWLDEQPKGEAPALYFLGAILLMSQPDEAVTFDIVDGKQRLITLTILACVLRDIADANRETAAANQLHALVETQRGVRRLATRGADDDYMRMYVQPRGATSLDAPSEQTIGSVKRLDEVRELFINEIMRLAVEERRRLGQHVAEVCTLAVVTTDDVDNAHRIFSVLNEGGKPLARKDILRAEILGRLTAATRERSVRQLDMISGWIGDDLDTFYSHVHAIEGRSSTKIVAGLRALIRAQGGDQFIETVLEPYARAFRVIRTAGHTGAPESPAINRLLVALRRLRSSDWMPAAMMAMRRHEREPQRLFAILRDLERMTYGIALLFLGVEKRRARMGSVITAFRNNRPVDGDGGAMALSNAEQRTILNSLRALHERKALVCKLVLMRIDDLAGGSIGMDEVDDYSVEHVLPQKVAAGSTWRTWFPDAEERAICCDLLGNLVLVHKRQNTEAQNHELDRKLVAYFRPDANPPAMTRELAGITEWRPASVQDRHERLVNQLCDLWRLRRPSRGEPPPEPDPIEPRLERRRRR